ALHLRGPGAWLGLTPHVLASLRGPLTAKKLRSQLVRWTVDAVGAGLRRTFGGCQQGRPWRERSCAGHSSRVSVLPRELPFRPVTGNSSVPEGNEVGSETGSVAEARRLAARAAGGSGQRCDSVAAFGCGSSTLSGSPVVAMKTTSSFAGLVGLVFSV